MDAEMIPLLVPATWLVMLAIEAVAPARRFPPIRGWRWLGLAFLILMGTVSAALPLAIPERWLADHRLIDGTGLGVIGGAAAGYLLLSFFSYLWHRAAHRFDWMWRGFHQIHHAPQRVDLAGSMLFHPLEMSVFVLLGVAAATLVLGLDPAAAALTGFIASFYSMFQHWNVRTPRWIGLLIQRPEAHCVHHQRGVHGYNYGDLPLWDLLFGTFRNPRDFSGEVGFDAPADRRLGAMLAFRDVNAPAHGPGSRGAVR